MAAIHKSLQSEALKLVIWQWIIIVVVSLVTVVLIGLQKGLAVFLGGSAYGVPQLLFTWWVFSFARVALIEKFMIYFFLSEFLKIIISAILFILAVKYLSVDLIFTMVGYITALVAFWFVCGFYFGRVSSLKKRVAV